MSGHLALATAVTGEVVDQGAQCIAIVLHKREQMCIRDRTGGDTGAIAGTLTLIVGATDEGIEPVRDILETFSSKIYCFGGPGKGQAAKLANQVALSSCMVGMADALSFAQQMGLDLAETREMILGGTGRSGAMEQLAPKSLDGDWKPGFMVTHFLKDLRLALAAAEEMCIRDSI